MSADNDTLACGCYSIDVGPPGVPVNPGPPGVPVNPGGPPGVPMCPGGPPGVPPKSFGPPGVPMNFVGFCPKSSGPPGVPTKPGPPGVPVTTGAVYDWVIFAFSEVPILSCNDYLPPGVSLVSTYTFTLSLTFSSLNNSFVSRRLMKLLKL